LDSVTQITLGAAVAEAVGGRKFGNRAMAWGALCGTLPDLDVLIPFGEAVADFTYHRGFSHSIFVTGLLAPLIVWLILKVHPQTARYRWRWAALVFLVFGTHILLDCFTVYGTQALWPLTEWPVSWSTVFIIDPAYTLPLIVGVVAVLVMGRKSGRGPAFNRAGLVLSSAYLAWTVGAKAHVETKVRASLADQGIAYQRLLTTPAPFNMVLWRIIVMEEGGYREAYYSLLDGDAPLATTRYESRTELLQGIEDHWPVTRLQWFTYGFYAVSTSSPGVVITDLRMGVEGSYVFRFKVGVRRDGHTRPIASERLEAVRDTARLPLIWKRIFDPAVSLDP